MEQNRASGILLHPSSLPSPDGIGDLGPEAFRWIDFLNLSGTQFWQILPLGPTGYGDSPYQCFSAFAGNPYLISTTYLLDWGLLTKSDLADLPDFPIEKVDYGPVINWKIHILKKSYEHFKVSKDEFLNQAFQEFQTSEADWLKPFVLFMAIKDHFGGVGWNEWPEKFRLQDHKTIESFKAKNEEKIIFQAFQQFLFHRQWGALKAYAAKKGIQIIGDIPIFVAYDSADVWGNRELFFLDEAGLPEVVAGVPPDYFSKTGQLWGNPLYKWSLHKKNGYAWWIKRMQSVLRQVDIVRLDHFRGFEAYWEVPFGNETAEHGRWVKGPGHDFFHAIKNQLGELPIIAEDLGVITDGVIDIRDSFNLPGMKIFQFSFASDPDDDFLPHNYPRNCFAYTGSHDNDTVVGWYQSATERERDFCRRYLARSGNNIAWSLIQVLWQSVANWALAPMQDFLSLGSWARMNYPGNASGNWGWRMHPNAIDSQLTNRIYELNYLYGRLPVKEKKRIKTSMQKETEGEIKPH